MSKTKCKKCGKPYSQIELEYMRKQKSDRIKAARAEAKMRGEQVGAHRKYDRVEIIRLHEQGFSYRKIAKKIGCSVSPVFAAVKQFIKDKP